MLTENSPAFIYSLIGCRQCHYSLIAYFVVAYYTQYSYNGNISINTYCECLNIAHVVLSRSPLISSIFYIDLACTFFVKLFQPSPILILFFIVFGFVCTHVIECTCVFATLEQITHCLHDSRVYSCSFPQHRMK